MEEFKKAIGDILLQDELEYVATVIQENFPGVDIELFEITEYRSGLRIIVPSQFMGSIDDLHTVTQALRDRLFWDRGTLIGYEVVVLSDEFK